MRALLRDKTGLSASLSEVLGALAISAAIMAAAGFGIGAAVNYGQDSGAKSTIESLRAAETLYETKNGAFATKAELGAGAKPVFSDAPDGLKVAVAKDKRDYCATIQSNSLARTQYLVSSRGGIIQLRTPFDPTKFTGCYRETGAIQIKMHGSVPLAPAAVPDGSSKSCFRFQYKPGPGVTVWYVNAFYLDADLSPVQNSKMPNPAGGGYTGNGSAKASDVDGVCFAIGPEVKYVKWTLSSAADSSAGARNGIGSIYSDMVVLFH